ncbi:metal cation symporter ZIP14-like [Mytilus californianus]|uniref:metal cation symporter ZIP14-like n=1 Tax=Mytilus californianus TaxID=6549 RepID=UPI002246F607|nr:metal cation symporter ZIP14-like [Mytilus californianus]
MTNSLTLCYLLFTLILFKIISLNGQCISNSSRIFLEDFMYNISGKETVTLNKLQTFFNHNTSLQSTTSNTNNFTSCSSLTNNDERKDCVLKHCVSIEDVLKLHSIPLNRPLTLEDVNDIAPALLFQKTSCQGVVHKKEEGGHKVEAPSGQVWGFGFLFVTIINICSLSGAVVLPCMKKTFYQKVLIFMVGLAVGSLAANALLVLIPEALGLMYTEDHEIRDNYIIKSATVIAGVYLFFLIERFLKIALKIKQTPTHSHGHEYYGVPNEPNAEENQYPSIKQNTPVNVNAKYKNTNNLPVHLHMSKSESSFSSTRPLDDKTPSMGSFDTLEDKLDTDERSSNNGGFLNGEAKRSGKKEKKQVATVAWMIIFGDGLHNFIDGLTIGAAFTDNILAGISICVSVFCEELPHELGDFAILLNSGMTVKKALMYNFLSACMCYFGLIVGILLGENTTAHDWVFAIAAGMFLYISLVDMMPEMNSAAESEENKKNIGSFQIFILQNVGLVLGFTVILIMSIYGGEINFEK